jgi:hypothetical protein
MEKRSTLDRLSQVSFILMCLVVAGVGVQRLTAGDARPVPRGPFEPGARLALHEQLRPGTAKASLVLALSTNCQYCTASMPFYRRLAGLDAVRNGRVKLLVVSLQQPEVMRAYLETHGMTAAGIVHAPESGVPLQATPTILLVGPDGAVVRSASGQLRADEEERLITDVGKASGN